MAVANFAGNKTFRREVAHFASTLVCETKPTDLEPPFNGISLILEPLTFGGAKSTDNSALGDWHQTESISQRLLFKIPFRFLYK